MATIRYARRLVDGPNRYSYTANTAIAPDTPAVTAVRGRLPIAQSLCLVYRKLHDPRLRVQTIVDVTAAHDQERDH